MPSMKQNTMMLRGLPPLQTLIDKLEAFGEQPGKPLGVISVDKGANDRLYAKVVLRSSVVVRQLAADKKEVKRSHRKDVVIDFMVCIVNKAQKTGYLEVYKGSMAQAKAIATALGGDVGTSIQADPISIANLSDLHAALVSAVGTQAAISNASVANFQADADVVGSFGPKFATTSDAKSFIAGLGDLTAEKGPRLRKLSLAFKHGDRKVKLSIGPDASVSINCVDDNEDYTRNIVRGLVGVPPFSDVNMSIPDEPAEGDGEDSESDGE